ncbi:MAG: serine/threonine-protein kinase [Gemmataceae bacterium]
MRSYQAGDEPVPGYRLLAEIGRGGCGVVWRATGPAGEVALKFIPLDDTFVAGLERRALGHIRGIQHPNLIRLVGSWTLGDHLIVGMELAEESLHDRLQRAVAAGLPGVPVEELLPLVEDAARGLDHLNAQQHPHPEADGQLVSFQHRDVKPRNLLVAGGRAKVGDWGLMRMLEGWVTGHTGALTESFAAPEFFQGRTTRNSDQYSLAVSYALLRTGRLPFRGDPREAHLHRSPDLSGLANPTEQQALLRALDKNPQNRWPSCAAFVQAARQALSGSAPTGSEPLTVSHAARAALHVPVFHAGGVVPPRYFIGRDTEQAEAQAMLQAGQSFLLVSQYRAGKTSFCRQVIHRLVNTPGNQLLPAYLNLQSCPNLNAETFREHTLVNLLGEIARQVFRCKYTDLLRDDPAGANPLLRGDPVFESFHHIFRLVTRRTHSQGDVTPPPLVLHEFSEFLRDLLDVARLKSWGGFALVFDEANRLPQELSVQLLVSNEEYLNAAGIVSVYVASPEMADAFRPLLEVCGRELPLGPFAGVEDLLRLLAAYCYDDPKRTDDVPLTEAAVDRLWRRSAGQPYLIQLVAQRAFHLARRDGAARVDEGHVEAAVEAARRERPGLLPQA